MATTLLLLFMLLGFTGLRGFPSRVSPMSAAKVISRAPILMSDA